MVIHTQYNNFCVVDITWLHNSVDNRKQTKLKRIKVEINDFTLFCPSRGSNLRPVIQQLGSTHTAAESKRRYLTLHHLNDLLYIWINIIVGSLYIHTSFSNNLVGDKNKSLTTVYQHSEMLPNNYEVSCSLPRDPIVHLSSNGNFLRTKCQYQTAPIFQNIQIKTEKL